MKGLLASLAAGISLFAWLCQCCGPAGQVRGRHHRRQADRRPAVRGALRAHRRMGEAATGAKVNVLSKKNHFELDKEIKSDIASGRHQVVRRRPTTRPSRRSTPTSTPTSAALLPAAEIDSVRARP